ncbi:hypothetical protein SBRY_50522 [Actinacidiphila bryophytorum]|uniref:Uncharacterized protein n=1 Tax=Actinacidiphila bryophytorum TaxID=1436133 RepID=A0A9W4H4M3_9ACTN|nr:hypothetical protein SBRY_50522 [Actinacidiphila bryophytorum]
MGNWGQVDRGSRPSRQMGTQTPGRHRVTQDTPRHPNSADPLVRGSISHSKVSVERVLTGNP